ncbi:ATP-binding cassette domain-containing protein [Halomonas sp. TD01]|uniref:ATP-binding cassette domain-containing protein n=1 Tax=Halomonas sp. TD01 TaxID=999141 RepID=UPI000214F1DD|nr:ATP-binding cassette domain-containing protein [Halomonas sp. TD01]EGP20022.1 hemin importer ATP-binding subunit [Halomonas sp. TD01]CAH1043081.1 ABC-type hemin transport system, ATPase component [Halomonas sp. TD01]
MLTLHQAGFTTTPSIAPLDGTLRPGELLAIVGPNGAGKSTLLSMLSGFRPCEQGELHLDGKRLSDWPISELANRRALVAQQELLGFDWQTCELMSLGSNPSSTLVAELLHDLDLTHLAKRSVLSLSGGERQRVMIARGACQLLSRRAPTAKDGGLLLLDEPTSALDIGQQQRLMRQLRTWAERHHMAIVCVLHDLNLAGTYADRVWLLHQGQRIAHGSPAEVLDPQRIAAIYHADITALSHPTSHRTNGTPWLALDH